MHCHNQRRRGERGLGEGVPLLSRLGSLGSIVSSPSGIRGEAKMFLVHFELDKNTSGDNKLVFACLEIPWYIGRIMLPDQAPNVWGGGIQPPPAPLVYATGLL